MICIKFIL